MTEAPASANDSPIRILGLTRGRISDPLASSGLNRSFFGALARRCRLDMADARLHGWQRYWNALRTFRLDRSRWHEAFDQSLWGFDQRTRNCERALARRAGEYDLVFQLYALFAPSRQRPPHPYVILCDNTYRLSERMYPLWAPLSPRARAGWYRREERVYRQAARIFARTNWVRRSFIEDYGVDPDRVVMVGGGTHFPDVHPGDREYDGRTILFVGKDFERKGVPCLLEAFARVRIHRPDARLLLVGQAADIRQGGVTVTGHVSDRQRLHQLYTGASVFVLPSVFEPCGNVLVEAMSHKLPCVATNVCGLPEVVDDGQTGYLVPPNRPEELANRIVHLLDAPELMRWMGQQGYERVQREFRWELVMDRMWPHLEQIVEEDRKGDGRGGGTAGAGAAG